MHVPLVAQAPCWPCCCFGSPPDCRPHLAATHLACPALPRCLPHCPPRCLPSDFYIRFHFIQFLKLYHNPHKDHQALFLCRQHMEALLVLAGDRSPHIRHRFHQLSGG